MERGLQNGKGGVGGKSSFTPTQMEVGGGAVGNILAMGIK